MSDTTFVCPKCRELLEYVWQYVTEQRKYTFHVAAQSYVGSSDPVDDTSRLDYLCCPNCFEELPEDISAQIQSLEEFFVGP